MELRSRRRYWNHIAGEKKFHHPLRLDWLDSHLGDRSGILDCGCGYGRFLAELSRRGYDRTEEFDQETIWQGGTPFY